MNSRRHPLSVLSLVVLSLAAFAQDRPDVVLENDVLRLTIKQSPAPHVGQLLHKAAKVPLIQDPTEHALFAVALRKPDGGTDYLDSATAKASSVSVQRENGDTKAVLTFSHVGGVEIDATVEVLCRRSDPLTHWSISVKNGTGRGIAYVRFPLLKTVRQIGEPSDDVIVLPYLPGSLIRNPWAEWRENQGVWIPFPGNLSAQFIAFQDRSAGVYFAAQDTSSHPRRMEIWKRKDGFAIAQDYTLNDVKARAWRCPYPVVIGVTQGTWCDSADIYKRWAQRQAWCAKTLAQRDDIPQWWKDGPLVHVCEVRTYDKKRLHAGSYYPKILDHLRFLREKTDGKILTMLAGWENHRRWTAGDYFPVFDEANAKRTIAEMKKDGFRSFFYLSGLYYTFENEGVNSGRIAAAEKHRDAYVIDKKTGEPQVFTLGESTKTRPWVRKSYEICVGTPFARPFFRSVIDRCHEIGVDVLQMDQTVSGACHACYSTKHNHPPGIGAYQAIDFHALLADMRSYAKARCKDFALFHEEPHEELIPYLDGFHMREYKEKWWYRGSPGAVGIPLFSYLYHEYAIGYGGDSARSSSRDDPWCVRMHAVNLITGKTPGLAVWSYPEQLLKSHPAPLKMLRNHCRLLKTRAKQYLMLGKMLHPYELDVPKATYKFWAGKGKRRKEYELTEPAILTSSWQAPDGGIGHVFVNVSKDKQTLALKVDTRNTPIPGPCDVAVYSSVGDGNLSPMWKGAKLPREHTKDLAPLEVLFIDIQKAK